MKKIILVVCVLALIATICLGCAACGLFKGKDAVGISSIEKTDTQGLVDTYTITLTDGTTSTFTVTNGQGSNQLPSDTYTPEHYFRFELLDDDTYMVSARYEDMYPTVVIPSKYNGKAVTYLKLKTNNNAVDNIIIQTSVKYIEFINIGGVTITYKGTIEQWNMIEKADEWNRGGIKIIHCADGDINLD